MTRPRAFVAAVPQRVWTAVAGLALLASLAIAAVIGAGLHVWRTAVGSTAQLPPATIEPPGSGLVVVPGGSGPRQPARPHLVPAAPPVPVTPPAGSAPVAPTGPVTVPAQSGQPATPIAVQPRDPFGPRVVTSGGQPAGFVDRALVIRLAGAEFRVPAPLASLIAHERHELRVAEHQREHDVDRAGHYRHDGHHARHAGHHARHAHRHGRHR